MTVYYVDAGSGSVHRQQPDELVTLTIDGVEMSVPKGTLMIRAAEQIGIAIPRFCDHPLLDPVAACRSAWLRLRGSPSLRQRARSAADGMVVRTQVTSEMADKAQRSVMEFLLINHPLDCPVCDKGGECPLQNQAMSNGRAETPLRRAQAHFPQTHRLSAQVLLDRERCVFCARCTRFSDQIAGDPFIEMFDRGSQQQVGIYRPTVRLLLLGQHHSDLPGRCPDRFRLPVPLAPFRPGLDPNVCEHCASGCAQRTDTVATRWCAGWRGRPGSQRGMEL